MSIPRRGLLVLLAAMFLVVGCGSSKNNDNQADSSSTSVVEDLDTETTQAVADPWAVPDLIDVSYVQRVVQEIENVRGRVRQDVWSRNQFDQNSKDRVLAIYGDPYLSFMLQDFSETSRVEHSDFKPHAAESIASVREVPTAENACIYSIVNIDDNKNRLASGPTHNFGVTLHPAPKSALNRTGWVIVESRSVDGYPKDDLCVR